MRNANRKNYKRKDKMSNKDIYKKLKSESCDEAATSNSDTKGFNDLSWYVIDEQVLNDAARIPYNLPVGMPFPRRATFDHIDSTDPNYTVHQSVFDSSMPGILVSQVMPILGNAQNPSDPVNVAANSVYQLVRSRNSGGWGTIDAVDFMIYFGVMDSVFSYCTYLSRLYATIYTYHQANRYLSRGLIESQNVDYDDLVTNLASFRARFNVLIAKIKSLYVPNNMPIFIRHAWMFSNYYIEGDSDKDQIYMHAPIGYYTFQLDNDGAGMMKAHHLHAGGTLTASRLLQILDDMIDPIYQDEDFNRISGFLLKAYEGKVFTVTEIPDIATVNLEHNEEVLLQFKNMKFLPVTIDNGFKDNAFDYVQDSTKRYLKFTMPESALTNYSYFDTNSNARIIDVPNWTGWNYAFFASKMMDASKDCMLTSPHADVTPGENMINSRLVIKPSISADSTSPWSGKIDDIAVGTEWPMYYTIFAYRRNRNTQLVDLFYRHYETTMAVEATIYTSVRTLSESQLPVLSCFKYHPELFITVLEYDADNNRYYFRNAGRSLFDVDNYTLVNFDTVQGLHAAAIMAQYNVPNLAIGK